MADGIPCANCGWQETDHYCTTASQEEILKVLPGRKASLNDCPEYVPEVEDSQLHTD